MQMQSVVGMAFRDEDNLVIYTDFAGALIVCVRLESNAEHTETSRCSNLWTEVNFAELLTDLTVDLNMQNTTTALKTLKK